MPDRDADVGTGRGRARCAHLAETLDVPSLLTFDMGGTSTDVAAITQVSFSYAKRHQIEWDIYSVLPMVEINSVGQGGGSYRLA